MEEPRNNLLAALDEVERRTEATASGWRLLLYAVILAPLAIAAPYILFSGDDLGRLLRVAIAGSGVLLAFSFWFGRRVRREVRTKLQESSVAQKIASGELGDDPIFALTPWPWRLLLPGRDDRGKLKSVLLRVAWNLDWYMRDRPSRLWRWQWVYALVALTVMGYQLWIEAQIWHVTSAATMAYFVRTFGWPGRFIFALYHLSLDPLLLAFLPMPFIYFRRQVWTEELVRYLRRQLES